MYIKFGARGSGKTNIVRQQICERINELETRKDFAKKFGLSYKEEEQELNSLYKKLDGGENRVKEKPNSATRKTTGKKNKNTPWRLL